MQPLIGVTAGEIINKQYPWAPVTYGQSRTYIDAVIHAGGIPVILPLSEDEQVLRKLYKRCDGLLFSGGNDIDPAVYHQKRRTETADVSRRRDDQEIALIKWALADDKPVLAICRGMQLLNVARGGTLYQHIPDDLPAAGNHTISTERKTVTDLTHTLSVEPDSRLEKLVGPSGLKTNAHHHQAVRELGSGLVVTARAEDDVVEGLEIPGMRFVVAVQSHPESLEAEAEPRWRGLFEGFVAAAKRPAPRPAPARS